VFSPVGLFLSFMGLALGVFYPTNFDLDQLNQVSILRLNPFSILNPLESFL
jgi:hypothetical protein